MQWVFLIGDQPFSLNSFSKMKFENSKKILKNAEQLEICYNDNDYAIFYKEDNADNMRNNFETSEFEKYLQKLPFDNPRWIMLKYSNIKTLKKIICEKYFPKDIIIDCDGVNLGLEEVFDISRIIETEPLYKL